jgi:hypothetical protein
MDMIEIGVIMLLVLYFIGMVWIWTALGLSIPLAIIVQTVLTLMLMREA